MRQENRSSSSMARRVRSWRLSTWLSWSTSTSSAASWLRWSPCSPCTATFTASCAAILLVSPPWCRLSANQRRRRAMTSLHRFVRAASRWLFQQHAKVEHIKCIIHNDILRKVLNIDSCSFSLVNSWKLGCAIIKFALALMSTLLFYCRFCRFKISYIKNWSASLTLLKAGYQGMRWVVLINFRYSLQDLMQWQKSAQNVKTGRCIMLGFHDLEKDVAGLSFLN